MAEVIFNQLAPRGTRAISAGSKPASEVNPLALAVLREIGIETSGLRPKLLTGDMAQQADKIVTRRTGGLGHTRPVGRRC